MWHVDVRVTSKHLEIGEYRLLGRPHLVWRLVLVDGSRRTAVSKKHRRHHRLTPVALPQSSMFHHAARTFNQRAVHSLGHSVELWGIWRRQLLLYSSFRAELRHLVRLVLASVVTLENLDTLAGLRFSKCDELHELCRDFGLVLEQIDDTVS